MCCNCCTGHGPLDGPAGGGVAGAGADGCPGNGGAEPAAGWGCARSQPRPPQPVPPHGAVPQRHQNSAAGAQGRLPQQVRERLNLLFLKIGRSN